MFWRYIGRKCSLREKENHLSLEDLMLMTQCCIDGVSIYFLSVYQSTFVPFVPFVPFEPFFSSIQINLPQCYLSIEQRLFFTN